MHAVNKQDKNATRRLLISNKISKVMNGLYAMELLAKWPHGNPQTIWAIAKAF